MGIKDLFNEILLKRENRELQYKLAKLSLLAERKTEIGKQTNIIMKIINFIPDNHLNAEYSYLLSEQESIENRIHDINQQLGNS